MIQLMTVAGLILGGCARDPFVTERDETYAGEWLIPHQIDRITGAELPSAYVFAEASNSNVDFPRVSSLLLTCIDGAPLIRFAFDFKIGSNRNTVLGYRFDGKPGHDDVGSRVVRGKPDHRHRRQGRDRDLRQRACRCEDVVCPDQVDQRGPNGRRISAGGIDCGDPRGIREMRYA
ncbi:hypothetical protein [Tardiphaga robiniae]|uniref:hypothetical protein n=1 Tax=Tardiphaga robiniae TaxID=943830 RepID=UPI001FCE8BBA|nr:hypothetical protein [Tardiphaga robiniae]